MIPFGTQSVTVQRAAIVSDHGNDLADWTTPTEHVITGCSVQPAGGTEDPISRDAVTTLWTVYAPLAADVLVTDRVVVFGTAYEVDGPIRKWAVGVLDHLEVNLKAVAG